MNNTEDIIVCKYTLDKKEEWNDFVKTSKNGTFLFDRNFMEYHSDRFQDYSLMIYKAEKLVAIFPANIVANVVHSHQGLTYGGLIVSNALKTNISLQIYSVLLKYLHFYKIKSVLIKMTPTIYHKTPSEELDYFAFICKAQVYRKDVLSVIKCSDWDEKEVSLIRKRGRNKALKSGLVIKEEVAFEAFWNHILSPNLEHRYKTKPVHTVDEIILLKKQFPSNIRQFNVYENDVVVGGTTIFETDRVAHCQYISGTQEMNKKGGLDLLYFYLLREVYKNKKYFDFGISNENDGRTLNKGLLYWKEGFGARSIVQDFYRFETESYSLLENVVK